MDAWIVSTKNTVSNNQPHHLHKVERKQLRFGVVFFFHSLLVIIENFLIQATKRSILISPATFFLYTQKKPVTQAQMLDMTGFL